MRVLLVDNYDSFTYNLVQLLATLGAEVLVRRNDAVDVSGALSLAPAAVVISPGPRTPADAGISVSLVTASLAARIPLLGVCLGHQAIGVALGGSIAPAPRLLHGKTSEVHHDGASLFRGMPDPFRAMRYHSLTITEPLPRSLVPTAWVHRAGGERELMGMRHVDAPIEGLQFHPESFMTPEGHRLLDNFLALARDQEVHP